MGLAGHTLVSPSSGAARHLLPEGEKNGPVAPSYSSPPRGEVARRSRVGEGVLRGVLALTAISFATPVSAANLVLPHDRYGNKEGCDYLATGNVDSDALQHLTKDYLATYGMGCMIVSVHADPAGNQRAEGICSHEGEDMLGAEDFIVAAPLSSGHLKIYTASGETWGELEPCL